MTFRKYKVAVPGHSPVMGAPREALIDLIAQDPDVIDFATDLVADERHQGVPGWASITVRWMLEVVLPLCNRLRLSVGDFPMPTDVVACHAFLALDADAYPHPYVTRAGAIEGFGHSVEYDLWAGKVYGTRAERERCARAFVDRLHKKGISLAGEPLE